MAWRIHHNVIRGEIDNRTRGVVSGRIWLDGTDEPLEIRLQGNACSDLAGCVLAFRNPQPTVPLEVRSPLDLFQRGVVGDLTASRKVRMPGSQRCEPDSVDTPNDPSPEQWGNCLYLEWFSDKSGRVVIEAVEWELSISAPEWRLTAADEEERARTAADGMNALLQRLDETIEKEQRGQKRPEVEWDEHDYGKFLRESDARADKLGELLDKYRGDSDAELKIDKAMGWNRKEGNESISEGEGGEQSYAEEFEAPLEPDPARKGIDWIRTENGEIRHPLEHRCIESALRFWERAKGVVTLETAPAPVRQFVEEFQITSVKLAGALGSIATDRDLIEPALTVAFLKRALGHLYQTQAGLESPATQRALPDELVKAARLELFEIREGILRLMDEFRGRKGPGLNPL